MSRWLLVVIAAVVLLTMAGGVAYYAARGVAVPGPGPGGPAPRPGDESRPTGEGNRREVVVDPSLFEDGGLALAYEFTGSIRDPKSLAELRRSIEHRGELGLRVFQTEL